MSASCKATCILHTWPIGLMLSNTPTCWKVRCWHVLHELLSGDVGVLDKGLQCSYHLTHIVRRDLCGNANSNALCVSQIQSVCRHHMACDMQAMCNYKQLTCLLLCIHNQPNSVLYTLEWCASPVHHSPKAVGSWLAALRAHPAGRTARQLLRNMISEELSRCRRNTYCKLVYMHCPHLCCVKCWRKVHSV